MKKGEKNTVHRAAKNVEPWWQELKGLYFSFHKSKFKDADGYALSPDWNPQKIGMEAGALKKIIIFLREIAEGKKVEWTLEYAESRMLDFLQRSFHKYSTPRFFYCAFLNKYKVDILCSSFNPNLARKIMEIWYYEFPNYTRDYEKDKIAAEIIIGFLKQQYILNSLAFEENSVLGSVRLIFITVKEDEWWSKKTMNSVARNLQEFVNRIKEKRNGGNNSSNGTKKAPVVTIKPRGGFGKL